eukprot:511523-Hanusia_phi.AAC.1
MFTVTVNDASSDHHPGMPVPQGRSDSGPHGTVLTQSHSPTVRLSSSDPSPGRSLSLRPPGPVSPRPGGHARIRRRGLSGRAKPA